MILLLMVIVLLALAWGLADIQLNAPIERPEPPLAEPISSDPSTELAPAPPVGELPVPPAAEPPPS